MTIINIREHPEYLTPAIAYIQSKWANRRNKPVYEDCLTHSITAKNPLPIWYILLDGETIIGCARPDHQRFHQPHGLMPLALRPLYREKAQRPKPRQPAPGTSQSRRS